jgi:hypothetical protein
MFVTITSKDKTPQEIIDTYKDVFTAFHPGIVHTSAKKDRVILCLSSLPTFIDNVPFSANVQPVSIIAEKDKFRSLVNYNIEINN